MDGTESDEDREKNGYVDNMCQRKHDCGWRETEVNLPLYVGHSQPRGNAASAVIRSQRRAEDCAIFGTGMLSESVIGDRTLWRYARSNPYSWQAL